VSVSWETPHQKDRPGDKRRRRPSRLGTPPVGNAKFDVIGECEEGERKHD
jgi:hypothetical protein